MAAQAAAQFALVDDARGVARALHKTVLAGQPVGVVEIQRGGHKSGNVDPRSLAEEHAVRVQQPYAPVAAQAAKDRRWVVAGDAIEYLAAGACLFEAHGIASADREAVPVDDRIRRIVHGERVAHRARRDLPCDRVHAGRQHLRAQYCRVGPECQQRAGGEGAHQAMRRCLQTPGAGGSPGDGMLRATMR